MTAGTTGPQHSDVTVAIELNDAGVEACVASERGAGKLYESPGYALLDGERLVTGREAANRARLRPRFVNHRFWSELTGGPLAAPFPPDLRPADLAHAHLREVWAEVAAAADRVLLVVPGSSSEGELGLILGIARACNMPVTGLVDSAVAAAAGVRVASGERCLHLDIQLHRGVVTELVDDGGSLVRERVEVSPETGLLPLYDAWTKRLAELFVRETRFDPLHGAATEQDLYDRLPEWLERLSRQERIRVAMEGGGGEQELALDREQLQAAADPLYEPLLALVRGLRRRREGTRLLLSHRLARLPGFKARLEGMVEAGSTGLESLGPGAAARGALEQRRKIEGRGGEVLAFVTRLERNRGGEVPKRRVERRAPRADGERPTHLLHGELAYPITRDPLVIGVAIPEGSRGINLSGETAGISRSHCRLYLQGGEVVFEDHSSYGSYVNDERVEGKTRLRAGDRLRLGSPGIELRLIRTLDPSNGDGPPPH